MVDASYPDTHYFKTQASKSTLPKDMDNGPLSDDKRECTDIICCLVFLAFLVGMVGVSGYGLVYGDPRLFLTMWDADGNGCGFNATKDYPYLYYPIIDIESLKKMGDIKDTSDV